LVNYGCGLGGLVEVWISVTCLRDLS
jgi:hypothetical protein